MVTGGGHSRLEETMSVVGVPVMSKSNFISTERRIGEYWKLKLKETMEGGAAAGSGEGALP